MIPCRAQAKIGKEEKKIHTVFIFHYPVVTYTNLDSVNVRLLAKEMHCNQKCGLFFVSVAERVKLKIDESTEGSICLQVSAD